MKIMKRNENQGNEMRRKEGFGNLFNEMDSWFDDFERSFNVSPLMKGLGNDFAVDVSENEKRFLVKAELPGVSENDIKVVFEDGILHISAEKKEIQEQSEGSFYRKEIRSGSFSRSFRVPDSVDADNIDASFKNGVLAVEIPKIEEQVVKKEIKVKKQ